MNTLNFSAALFILLLGFVSFANAHMQFVNPKSRGHGEDTMSQAPCGGYNDVVASAVTDFPVTSKNSFKRLFLHSVKYDGASLDSEENFSLRYDPYYCLIRF